MREYVANAACHDLLASFWNCIYREFPFLAMGIGTFCLFILRLLPDTSAVFQQSHLIRANIVVVLIWTIINTPEISHSFPRKHPLFCQIAALAIFVLWALYAQI